MNLMLKLEWLHYNWKDPSVDLIQSTQFYPQENPETFYHFLIITQLDDNTGIRIQISWSINKCFH